MHIEREADDVKVHYIRNKKKVGPTIKPCETPTKFSASKLKLKEKF